jgi:signal transduction histidine kinase
MRFLSSAHDDDGIQPDEAARRGTLVLRTLPILLIPFLASFVTFALLRIGGYIAQPTFDQPVAAPFVPVVVAVMFGSALIILVRMGQPTLSALVLVGAWTLMTTLIALRFGVTTFFPAMLAIPICAAGLLIDRFASMSLAALATILVTAAGWLEMQGFPFADAALPQLDAAYRPIVSIGFWVGLFWAVAALTSLLAGSLQKALRESRARAEELRELSAQLEARVQQQTALLIAQERESATLEERARLAREIHDTLAQGLTGIVVQLGAAQRALAAAPAETEQHLELAQRMARESLAEARRSVWNLRPMALERGDLGAGLQSLVARRTDGGPAMRFEQRGEPAPLPPEVESALLRVGQEALANVEKHARAASMTLLLEYEPHLVRLTIHDDGIGFATAVLDGAPQARLGSGFGLLGMRERLAALGGSITLRNDAGATIVAEVPVPVEG